MESAGFTAECAKDREKMLEIKNLHVSTQQNEILQGINFNIKPGEVHAIMGPNGSGKSTLGKTIAEMAKTKGIKKVVFDRNGFKYHGRVKALAESVRAEGLEC